MWGRFPSIIQRIEWNSEARLPEKREEREATVHAHTCAGFLGSEWMTSSHCPFCTPDPDRVFFQGKRVYALWDAFPVTDRHALIVPRRHVAGWFDATPEEQAELIAALSQVKEHIETEHAPDGYNMGINDGEAAGQTIHHLHLHVMADLCVTQGKDSGALLPLSTRELTDQFIRLYWRQAAPFPAGDTEDPLRQNTGRQAAVVNAVQEARAEYDDHLGKVENGGDRPSSAISCSAPPGATSSGTGRFSRMSSKGGASTVTGA